MSKKAKKPLMKKRPKSRLLIAITLLVLPSCTPSPPKSPNEEQSPESRSYSLDKEFHVLGLVSSKHFLENPSKNSVELRVLEKEIEKTAALLGLGVLNILALPPTVTRSGPRSTENTYAPLPTPPHDEFNVTLSTESESVPRHRTVKFYASAASSSPSPEFQFATVKPVPNDCGVDEVPIFEHPPTSYNEFETFFDEVGETKVVVRAFDASGSTARATSTVVVTNAPPKITVENLQREVHRGEKITPVLKVSDPEGDSVSVYAEVPESAKIEKDPNISFSIQELGTHKIKFVAKDEYGDSTVTNVSVTVTNRPPTIAFDGGPKTNTSPNVEVLVSPRASDPDGDSVNLQAETSPGRY